MITRISGFIWIPKTQAKENSAVEAWVFNVNEQGGFYKSIEAAKENKQEFESYTKKGFCLYPIEVKIGNSAT